jgi:DNA-binding transcriptional ArsR family regulator
MTPYDAQLHALGDATRRAIVMRLRTAGAMPVVELAREFPISRPAISQHLKVLKDARLVTDEARGRLRLYRLDPAGFSSLRDYFDQFWTEALDAFAKHVETRTTSKRRTR